MKVAVSFFAFFSGWAVAWVSLMIFIAGMTPWGGVSDFDSLTWLPLVFGLVGWAVFGLPFVYKVSPESRWMRFPRNVASGALLSYTAYCVLIGWAVWPVWYFHVFAALVGTVALPLYSALVNRLENIPSRGWFAIPLFAMPPVILVGFSLAFWPFMERRSPSLAYRYGSLRSQARIFRNVLEHTRPGDSFESLRSKLPGKFSEPFLDGSGSGYGFRYHIRVEEGIIREISIEDDREQLSN